MRIYTLGFLFKDGKIILAKKQRKIGVGKYNGYGGRVEEGEDRPSSLVREIGEESRVVVEKQNCKELGFIDFYFQDSDGPLRVYMYRIDEFEGFPVETEEMGIPMEFDLDKIPYREMMVGDDKFLPFIIKNEKFEGVIYFDEEGKELRSFKMNEIL